MTILILRLYDFFTCRKWLLFGIVLAIVAGCAWSVSHIRFTEDISAFLPIKHTEKDTENSLPLNAENTLIVSVRMTDTNAQTDIDLLCDAILFFADYLQNQDSGSNHIKKITAQTDPEQFFTLSAWIIDNMPYLLTDSDYLRLDTLLTPQYVQQQINENRLLLLSPAGMALRQSITTDPLHLSIPLLQRLQDLQQNNGYELYDDFIFTNDKKEGIITLESNYSVSETQGNIRLLALIDSAAKATSNYFDKQVTFHSFGAADIAITNSQRIRKDSLLSVSIAVVLISLVLIFSIRSLRGILLMFLSLICGWIFALGILGLFKSEISLIAVGISSIIIGIAMNYPLHLILHHKHNSNIRDTLKDLVPPLTIGNITTVVAFLSLLFVNAPAMRDMGLFAALLLLGVILFVLLVLPHCLPAYQKQQVANDNTQESRYDKKPIFFPRYIKKLIPLLLLVFTIVLLPFSTSTTFETDMNKINYMTAQQKQDMNRFISQSETLSKLMPDQEEQIHRLAQWQSFVEKQQPLFASIPQTGVEAGFKEDAFDPFLQIISQEYNVKETSNAGTLLRNMVSVLAVDFNKVLYFCGIVVFVFLCMMLGRLELGILAFLPLAIGWIWILGIMHLFDIHFNIVNIILATLIFGQGDDYTIFITEGLMHEYAYGKKLLKEYRKSIIISAIILFAGIGALITAQHPAMRSLAEVTLVGMGVVVLVAYVVPPFIYKWLTESKGVKRRNPVTLVNLLCSLYTVIVFSSCCLLGTMVGFCLFTLGKSTDAKKEWYHRFIYRAMRFFQRNIPLVKVKTRGMENLHSLQNNPAIIISNHQSHLDLMCIVALYPKLIILTKEWVSRSPIFGIITRYADFYTVDEGWEITLSKLQEKVSKGYSIMIFPEGTRSKDGKMGRFHSGAFHLAQQLNLDILPVLLHGCGDVLPTKDFMLRKGEITVEILPFLSVKDRLPLEAARFARHFYKAELARLSREKETADYFADTVLLNFLYKGAAVARGAKTEYNRLKKEGKLNQVNVPPSSREITLEDNGYGIYGLLFALVHKETQVNIVLADQDKASLLRHCAVKPENLTILTK
jgi:1-acyl-sn-glycerol-3-phosphate acyltransferase